MGMSTWSRLQGPRSSYGGRPTQDTKAEYRVLVLRMYTPIGRAMVKPNCARSRYLVRPTGSVGVRAKRQVLFSSTAGPERVRLRRILRRSHLVSVFRESVMSNLEMDSRLTATAQRPRMEISGSRAL